MRPGIGMYRTYWEKLKDPRWQKKRLEIMQRAGFRCEACGDKDQTLHVHHGYYDKGRDPWDYEDSSLHCLCEVCHDEHGATLRDVHREIGMLQPKRYSYVMTWLLNAKQNLAREVMQKAESLGILLAVNEAGALKINGPADAISEMAPALRESKDSIEFLLETQDYFNKELDNG